MSSPITPLRPNYLLADFKVGQSIVLRCDGSTGVPRFMHGGVAVVVKATTRRVVVTPVNGRDNRQLRVTPNQVESIVEESQA